MSRSTLITVLIVAGLALLLGGLYSRLEPSERIVQGELLEPARSNPLYLAERLAESFGLRASSVRLLPPISELSADDIVVMSAPSYTLTMTQTEELLAWVEQGGHWLVAAHRHWDGSEDNDPLLERLQAQVVSLSGPEAGTITATVDWQGSTYALRGAGPRRLQDPEQEANAMAHDGLGAIAQEYAWGAGRITLVSSPGLFHNPVLARADNARWLLALLEPWPDQGQLWLQYTLQVPSLLQRLGRYAWMPLLGGVLALVALLWLRAGRHGPLRLDSTTDQRSLLEHIDAVGRYLWRQQAGPLLLAAARRRALAPWVCRLPHWQQLSETEQIRQLQELTDLSIYDATLALRTPRPLREQDFLQAIQILQRLEHPPNRRD